MPCAPRSCCWRQTGASNMAIAEQLGITRVTVATWRNRFAARRLDGLLDEPRPGAPRTVSDEKVAEVVTATLETLPTGRTHWSSRSMAKAAGTGTVDGAAHLASLLAAAASQRDLQAVDRSAVRREGARHRRPLPQPAGARPGAVRRREVADPGARPHPAAAAAAPRPGRAAHARLQAARHDLAIRRARREGRDHHWQVPAAPPRAGVPPLPRHRREERAQRTSTFTSSWTTHPATRPSSIRDWFAKRPRWHVHYTPTSASWINQVERFFALLTDDADQARRPPLHRGTRSRDHRLHRCPQRRSQALPLDQDAPTTSSPRSSGSASAPSLSRLNVDRNFGIETLARAVPWGRPCPAGPCRWAAARPR